MTNLQEADELTDLEIRQRYGKLIDEAVQAFAIDANYAADLAKKANLILARRAKRKA